MTIRRIVPALAVVAAGLALWQFATPRRDTDLHRANALLALVPPPPGVRESSRYLELRTQDSCDESDYPCVTLPAPSGHYVLTVSYRVPGGMRARDVHAWYRGHLRGWTETHPYPTPVWDFHRRHASIAVDAQQIAGFPPRSRWVQVTVDPGS
jgi:hypothetical protein